MKRVDTTAVEDFVAQGSKEWEKAKLAMKEQFAKEWAQAELAITANGYDSFVSDLLRQLAVTPCGADLTALKKDRDHGLAHGAYVATLCLCASVGIKKINREVLLAAAWLHDVANVPIGSFKDHEVKGAEIAKKVLDGLMKPGGVTAVVKAIKCHRWKPTDGEKGKPISCEAKIVRDFDELSEVLQFGRIIDIKLDWRRKEGLSTELVDDGQYREANDPSSARADLLLEKRKEDSEFNDIATQLLYRAVRICRKDFLLSDVGKNWREKNPPLNLLVRAIRERVLPGKQRKRIFTAMRSTLEKASKTPEGNCVRAVLKHYPGHFLTVTDTGRRGSRSVTG